MDRYTSHDVSDRLRAHLGVFKTSRGASDTDLVTAGHSDVIRYLLDLQIIYSFMVPI